MPINYGSIGDDPKPRTPLQKSLIDHGREEDDCSAPEALENV